jgi:hypothetical protein
MYKPHKIMARHGVDAVDDSEKKAEGRGERWRRKGEILTI